MHLSNIMIGYIHSLDDSLFHHGSHAVLISGKSAYFETWSSRPWKSPYFWIFSIEVREKSWFSIAVKTWMIHIVLRKFRFLWVLWQWRRTVRESQRPVNQSPVVRGMTPSGSRQNTTCFIHKILLRSNWEPIGRHMMSLGSCTQFDWSTVSPVHMAHALQNIEHIRGNTATYLRLNSTNEWSVCT